MRIRSIVTLSFILLVLSTPISHSWILQSKNFPIAISEISPYPNDEVYNEISDSNKCKSGESGVFNYEYTVENLNHNCILYVYFPDKTKGNWHVQVLVDEGKWIDAWSSNLFACGDAGDLQISKCRVEDGRMRVYKSDSISTAIHLKGEKIDPAKIGKKEIWYSSFNIPTQPSPHFCQVFSGNIDYRIRATLSNGKSIYSPPFTVIYSGDKSFRTYVGGKPACDGAIDLDAQGNQESSVNPNFGQYSPTSTLKSNWNSFKVEKPINISQATILSVSKKSSTSPSQVVGKAKSAKPSSCTATQKKNYSKAYEQFVLRNKIIDSSRKIKEIIEDAREKKSRLLGYFVDYTAKDLYTLNKQDADISKNESERDDWEVILRPLAEKCNLRMPSRSDLS